MLDEIEKNTVDEIEDKYKILIHKIEEGMKQLDTSKASVTSARDKLASASSNVSQNFVDATKGKRIASNAAKSLKENNSLVHTDDIDFEPDQRIPALLEDVNTLGKTIQRNTGTTDVSGNTPQPAERTQKYSAAGNDQQKDALLKVKGSKKYSVRVQSDENECGIVSACTLEDGTIILSDYSNYKLKRLDSSSYTVTSHCDLPTTPWQVCPINTHQVAVCLPVMKEVNFIAVKGSLTISNKITTDSECFGLAYACGNLYISDSKTSVYIYSVSGRKLKQFSMDQSGQEIFSDIRSLAVNEDGSRIYVTDFNNGLIVLDNNGRAVGKFNSSQLQHAYGSYLTCRGSLLVCGCISNNVLQFGLNGELIGELVKDTDVPHAICCNKQLSKMIICRGDDDEIDVYDLV